VHGRRLGKEGGKIMLLCYLLFQFSLALASKTEDNLVNFRFSAVFALGFLHIRRIYPGVRHTENKVVWHGLSSFIAVTQWHFF
jgi:hypothetical protein